MLISISQVSVKKRDLRNSGSDFDSLQIKVINCREYSWIDRYWLWNKIWTSCNRHITSGLLGIDCRFDTKVRFGATVTYWGRIMIPHSISRRNWLSDVFNGEGLVSFKSCQCYNLLAQAGLSFSCSSLHFFSFVAVVGFFLRQGIVGWDFQLHGMWMALANNNNYCTDLNWNNNSNNNNKVI